MTYVKSWQEQEIVPMRTPCARPPITSPDSPHQKRILLISPFLPFPPESGAKQRTYFLWKALSEIAPLDVILCTDPYKPIAAVPSMPASLNLLGRFQWQPRGYSIHRLFEKSIFSLTIDRILHVAIPKHWDYEVDYRVKRGLLDVLRRNQYFLAVGR